MYNGLTDDEEQYDDLDLCDLVGECPVELQEIRVRSC